MGVIPRRKARVPPKTVLIGVLDPEPVEIVKKSRLSRYGFDRLTKKDQSLWFAGVDIETIGPSVCFYAKQNGLKLQCRTMSDETGDWGVRVWRRS